MFKPGDVALIVSSKKLTTITNVPKGKKWVVETTDGIFDESELHQAHQTVLDTAEAKRQDFFETRKAKDLLKSEVDFELAQKVIAKLDIDNVELDLRGHWKNSTDKYFRDRFRRELRFLGILRTGPKEAWETLLQALESGSILDTWIDLGRAMIGSDGCSYCGADRFHFETNGKVVRLSGDNCPLPNGFEPTEWELNVPSGKLVVANDLRRWFPLPEGDGDIPSINTVLGCRMTALAYAKAGMSHAFVGNTCPGVYRLTDKSFKLATEPRDEYWNGKDWVPYKRRPKFKGERVAGVCTDLWWYSLCDLEEFERRIVKFGGSLKEAYAEVIDVTPGVYRFRHNDDFDRDEFKNEVVYATFEWVRDADPVKNFIQELDEVEVNAHAYVQSQVKRWPTLYGTADPLDDESGLSWDEMSEEQRTKSWQRVADHIFFTIGGGTDWHEKGFPSAKVEPNISDIEPPQFRQQWHWYPFSEGYGGIFGGVKLSPSFARLAFRCLESVISFGMNVHDGEKCREVSYTRERMLKAVKKYRKMAKQYPELADPDYVWWLKQKGRAEAWVERFDLGPKYTERHLGNAQKQRWVPEDAYAIEFDARKLDEGLHFAGPHGWAHKKSATGFAIEEWSDNKQKDPEDNCFWSCHAIRTAIPLYSVARVVKVGEISHMGKSLVELAFDYGTDWMQDASIRKAVEESTHKNAIRVLTKQEYEKRLRRAELFYSKKSNLK